MSKQTSEKTKQKINKMADSLTLNDARYHYWTMLLSGFIQTFSPFLVPLAPASFVGFEVYDLTIAVMPHSMALVISIISAAGMEIVGYVSSHTTLRVFEYSQRTNSNQGKVIAGAALVAFYMVTAVCIILFSEQFTYVAVGVGMVILTIITYMSDGLAKWVKFAEEEEAYQRDKEIKQIEKVDLVEQDQREKEYQLELKRLEISAQKAVKIAEAKAKAKTEIEKARLEIPQIPMEKLENKNTSSGIGEADLEILKTLKALFGESEFSVKAALEHEQIDLGKSSIYNALSAGYEAGVVHKPKRGVHSINGIEEL